MKKTLFLVVLFVFTVLPSAFSQADLFSTKPLDAVITEAGAETKPVLAFFYTEDSEAAERMFNETFGNKWVSTYIQKRYKAVKIKAFTVYGDPYVKRYGLKSYPSVVIINSLGEVQDITTGFIPSKKLLADLKRYEEAPYNLYRHSNAKTNKPLQDTLPDSLSGSESFNDESDALLSIKLQEEAKVEGIYKFNISEHQVLEKTLAVQVGVFSDYHNLVKNVLELNKNWHSNILVTSYEVGGESIYRLLLGPFYTSEHALSYRKNLLDQEGLRGVIISMEDFSPLTEEEIEEYSVERFKK